MEKLSPIVANLLLPFLLLILVVMSFTAGLILFRRRRLRSQPNLLPQHAGEEDSSKRLAHRRRPALIIGTSVAEHQAELDLVRKHKLGRASESVSPPESPIPEIRITFPEEISEDGKRQSGRMVVVRAGENGIGLEPVDEDLPSYQEAHKTKL